jgi:DNA-binding CsgD family transcriptional regulator
MMNEIDRFAELLSQDKSLSEIARIMDITYYRAKRLLEWLIYTMGEQAR